MIFLTWEYLFTYQFTHKNKKIGDTSEIVFNGWITYREEIQHRISKSKTNVRTSSYKEKNTPGYPSIGISQINFYPK